MNASQLHLTLSVPLIVFLLALLAFFSAFFSISETAIIGLSRIRLRHMVAQGVKRAKLIQGLIARIDKFITAILICNNFVNIAISALVTALCVHFFGYKWGVITATFGATFFVLLACEITPKILATKHTERIALFVAPFMELLLKVLKPVVYVFTSISSLTLRILRMEHARRSPIVTEEEIRMMIEIGKEEGVLSDEERKMLHRIFEFGDTKVKDVMVPREKIVGIERSATAEELLTVFIEQGHARLPVYDKSKENIVGIIYAHDLLYILREKGLFVLDDLLHKAYMVSASMPVNELLRRFQADKIQIAIVVNEQKKALGLVTLEDLIEEIVGEIEEVHPAHAGNKN